MATKSSAVKSSHKPGQSGSVVAIVPMGISPRFPKVADYLKGYTLFPGNWQREQIPELERYGAGKAGPGTHVKNGLTLEFGHAARNLHQCASALQWHAIYAALGGTKPEPQGKAGSVTALATQREFEKLAKNGKHVHMSTPPVMLAEEIVNMQDEDVGPEVISGLDQEISESEYKIVRHLLLEGHALDAVEAALLEFGPELALRKGKDAAAYVADTMQRVQKDKQLKAWADRRQAAQQDAAATAASGTDWLEFWRRAVACNFLFLRMMRDSGDLHYNLLEIVKTAACCLALGWTEAALTLYGDICRRWTQQGFYDVDAGKKPFNQRRTQYFLLRLIAGWQGTAPLPMPPRADDEPLFAALLANWRSPDTAALAPLLLAACDRHTHIALIRKDSPDFDTSGDLTYLPFEILAVLRLRSLLGLPNPELVHPLLATPLGVLPPASEFFVDALLAAVLTQARKEMPDL